MDDFFSTLGKRISDTVDEFGKKAEDTLEIQKLKGDIYSLKRENSRDFADIGKISAIFPAANRMLSRHTLSFASCSFFVFMAISVFSLFSYHWIDFFTSDPSNNIILGELL